MALLDHVREFVSQKLPPLAANRIVLAPAKDHIVSHRVRQSIHRARRPRRLCARMNAHIAKIVAKARFKIPAGRAIQRLARRAQYVVYDRRHAAGGAPLSRRALQRTLSLLFACGALSGSRSPTSALPL